MSFPGTPVDEGNFHHLRDILETYNRVTELCFRRCAANFNYRDLTSSERSCVDKCGNKFVVGNQKIMSTFVEIQSAKQQQMFNDANEQQQQAQVPKSLPQVPQEPSDSADISRTKQSSIPIPTAV